VRLQPASTPQQRAGTSRPGLGAGHGAAIMASAGIRSAMLFVRSDAGGVSHAPEDSARSHAIAACGQALESALRELAA
jgi:N-carbamoyl-L-amino-acid hydrolase